MAVLHLCSTATPPPGATRSWPPSPGTAGSGQRAAAARPYHLIGAEMPRGGGPRRVRRHVRREHPDAPLPAVSTAAEGLLDNARATSRRMGDEASSPGCPGRGRRARGLRRWRGTIEARTPRRGAARLGAAQRDPRRVRVVMPSSLDLSAFAADAFVALDAGLAALSRPRRLGYDAVVLFLDELMLWLARQSADPSSCTGRPEARQARRGAGPAPRHPARQLHRPAARPARVPRQPRRRRRAGSAFEDHFDWSGRRGSTHQARGPQPAR